MSETMNSKDVQVVPENATNTDITMAGTGTGAGITVPGGENGEEIRDAPYRYATPEQSQENKAISDEGIFSPGCPILVEAEKDAERSINGEGKLSPGYQTHIEAEKEAEKPLNGEGDLAPTFQNQAEAENESKNGYPKEAKGEQVEKDEANEKEETEKKPDDNNDQGRPLPGPGQITVQKLSPVCSNCKRAKVRCTHRKPLGYEVIRSKGPLKKRKREIVTEDEINAAPPAAKISRQVHWGDDDNGNRTSAKDKSTEVPNKQGWSRKLRKRKFSQVDEDEASSRTASTSAPSPPPSAVEKVRAFFINVDDEPESSPRKKSKRGRKPNKERVQVPEVPIANRRGRKKATQDALAESTATNADSSSSSNAGTSSSSSQNGASPAFPADPLQGAIHLSRHTSFSQQLRTAIEDCQTKWQAAIDSLETAKFLLDNWVDGKPI
ncbi:hypothetical protein MAP00_007186 [Monascus purpureus]|nr:hypothetical protein MAP00_007186 [Monascus purpureus]